MTEPTDDRTVDLRAQFADSPVAENPSDRRRDNSAEAVPRPTPKPRSLAEALDVDPDRDDVKG